MYTHMQKWGMPKAGFYSIIKRVTVSDSESLPNICVSSRTILNIKKKELFLEIYFTPFPPGHSIKLTQLNCDFLHVSSTLYI